MNMMAWKGFTKNIGRGNKMYQLSYHQFRNSKFLYGWMFNKRYNMIPYYPCPAFIGDPNPDPHGLRFKKWCKHDQTAWKIYWLTHKKDHDIITKNSNL